MSNQTVQQLGSLRIANPVDNALSVFPEQAARAAAVESRAAQVQQNAATPNLTGATPALVFDDADKPQV